MEWDIETVEDKTEQYVKDIDDQVEEHGVGDYQGDAEFFSLECSHGERSYIIWGAQDLNYIQFRYGKNLLEEYVTLIPDELVDYFMDSERELPEVELEDDNENYDKVRILKLLLQDISRDDMDFLRAKLFKSISTPHNAATVHTTEEDGIVQSFTVTRKLFVTDFEEFDDIPLNKFSNYVQSLISIGSAAESMIWESLIFYHGEEEIEDSEMRIRTETLQGF